MVCDCGKVKIYCPRGCGCVCESRRGGTCWVFCSGGPIVVIGKKKALSLLARVDLHTHGSIPRGDLRRLLSVATNGRLKASIPRSKINKKVRLRKQGVLSSLAKQLG